jgi:hypothetical protein
MSTIKYYRSLAHRRKCIEEFPTKMKGVASLDNTIQVGHFFLKYF